ncbi:DEAD/DEAH box helicase [Corynebacterium breve]|uniref:DEAD/DEAH box helicase n=1 Tax=Corynebacterium breve TaxID=3049799 RepID=A0ABY8VI04_9CORY|nr:DEAD/DEAH box helicase [Corynebacterium breve]WIM68601.1 DEAD/DEAH box helicase [Corynebacterium breve]
MPKFLLHGLWLPDSGLNLWVEMVEGHKIVLPSAAAPGTFPPVIEALLDDEHFRRRVNIKLQTPKGRHVELRIPAAAFAPEETISFLSQIAFLDDNSPAATKEQRAAIAPDLYWIIRMYTGITKFARAGRVTIRVNYADHQWYPEWQLGTGLEERGWLADMVAAAPGVIAINNVNLTESIAQTFVHWIVSARLRHLLEVQRPYPWHDFAESLLMSAPLRRGNPQLLKHMNAWNGSITAVNVQLVFIVEQPEDTEQAADPGAQQWPVRLQVRSGTDAPRPIRLGELDPNSTERLKNSLRQAITITSLVDATLHPRRMFFDDDQVAGDWDVFLSTEDIVRFVQHEATRLKAAGFTVMLPRAWSTAETSAKLNVQRASEGADGSSVTRLGFDQLVSYDWRVSVGDTQLTHEEMQDLIRSKSGLIKLRGEWVLADNSSLAKIQEYMEKLSKRSTEQMKKRLEQAAMRAEFAKANGDPNFLALEAEVERLRDEYNAALEGEGGVVTAEELRALALESLADEPLEFTGSPWFTSLMGGPDRPAPERIAIPDTVQVELREYQRRGVDWLYYMSRNNLGAVLADDMGLGKTLQLLTLLAVEADRGERGGPTLVVAPTSVVGNWANEARRFVPHLKVEVHHGAERLHGLDLQERIDNIDILITSYGVVGRDFKELSVFEWDHVVLDEAQAIKNSSTRASRSVRAIPARHRIALTGTPIENRLSEMRSILDFVNPGMLGGASFFRNHFSKPIETARNEELAMEMGERLRTLTAPFILRRLKTDPAIIDDLPEKDEQIVVVDMTAEQAALYKALTDSMQQALEERSGMARKGLVLATITRIKQICNHPAHYLGDGSTVTVNGKHRSGKVEELMKLLNNAVEQDRRVLIFTQYKAFGDILQPYLSTRFGEHIPFLHGGVTKNQRDKMVASFQKADGPRAMILSLKAGGTGLNLTAASIVIHMDRWWNPAVENQATDRAYRIGQDKDVDVYKMITRGTMEESIQDVLDGKMHLAGTVVGEGEGWITELDSEDLARLISYRAEED